MRVPHGVLNKPVRPLQDWCLKGFVVDIREVVRWRCVSLLVSYYCIISECQNIAVV